MKRKHLFLLTLIILSFPSELFAVSKYFQGYNFEAYLVSDSTGGNRLYGRHNYSEEQLLVEEGTEYSVVIKNPLPVRVGVALSIDGLNSIDGKRTRAAQGKKWIIAPYQSITVEGWQVDSSRSRKFVFEKPRFSYANWKEKQDGQKHTKNLGVIGIAYFWSSHELQRALEPQQPFAENYRRKGRIYEGEAQDGLSGSSRGSSLNSKQERAGTGMGRNQHNPVRNVH